MPPAGRYAPGPAEESPPGAADPDQDRRLVAAAKRGDRLAFQRLVEMYGGLVYRVIGRLVRDPDDRDDLMQETLMRALQGLDGFRPGAAFRPWLVTIAVNAARDHLRRRRTWSMVSLAAEGDEEGGRVELADRHPGPDEEAGARELEQRLDLAYRRLPGEAQTILWLRAGEGLSYGEIANVLGIAAGTVMSRLSRARAALRRAMADLGAAGKANAGGEMEAGGEVATGSRAGPDDRPLRRDLDHDMSQLPEHVTRQGDGHDRR